MAAQIDSKYTIEVFSPSGDSIADLSRMVQEKNLQFVRNDTYNANWKMNIDDLEHFASKIGINPRSILGAGKNKVVISRHDVPLYSGQISYYESDMQDQKILDIRSMGWFDLLKDRQTSISRVFGDASDTGTWVDSGQIAWTLIDESQSLPNGDFGIRAGTIQASVTRARTFEVKLIKDAIAELTGLIGGFDFEITPAQTFNVYFPKMGVRREEIELVYPSGNIKDFKVITDATQLVNYVLAKGQGFGEGELVDILQDSASQDNYKLRQSVQDYSDIPDVDTLDDLANGLIGNQKEPLNILQITLDGNREPFIGSYWLGDEVRVSVEGIALYNDITGFYKIDEIDIKIDENDNEEIQLKLTAV